MIPPAASFRLLVLDANVPIDYCEANRTLLRSIALNIAPIAVPSPVLAEVEQLTAEVIAELGLEVVEPPLQEMTAAAQKRAGLSFQDRLCLWLAKERQAAGVTNDGKLRREYQREGIPVLWGLEQLVMLVRRDCLEAQAAIGAVEKIHAANPRFVTQKIVDDFIAKIGDD